METENQTLAAETGTDGYRREEHPWLEMSPEEDSIDEAIRYSLDEIRIA